MTVGGSRRARGARIVPSMAQNNRCRNQLTEGQVVEGRAHGKSARLVPYRGPGRRRLELAAFGLLRLGTALLGPTLMCAQGMPPWVIGPFSRPASGNPVIAPDPASDVSGPHCEGSGAMGGAAHVQSGGDCAGWQGVCALPGRGQFGDDADRRCILRGWAWRRARTAFTSRGGRGAGVLSSGGRPEGTRMAGRRRGSAALSKGEDGTYVLTYTQWNRMTYSVGIATSPDLEHWTKHGPAFLTAAGGKYAALKYKSAGIVTRLDRIGRLIAAKISGKYWMYWGEGAIHLATSEDAIHWTPVEDADGEPVELLRPRRGTLTAPFPETGPPPVLTTRESWCSTTARTRKRVAIRRWGRTRMRRGKLCSTLRSGASADADGQAGAEAGIAV